METQPSASALNVARCRAIASHEPREEIRGNDYLAEVFLDAAARQSLQNPAAHPMILRKLDEFSPGGYEYFIARTAYLDGVVEQALRNAIPQLVFLGAGYDTRACRFREFIDTTRVFELDNAATQERKRALLKQAHVVIPEQLAFVSIDFTIDKLSDKLSTVGYSPEKQTLFIWEGVSYYLPPQAVDDMLRFVRCEAPPGSIICFDYMLPTLHLEARFGAQQARAAMQTLYTTEPLQFDPAEAEAEAFLVERGFEIVEHLTAADMQARFLTLRDGTLAGRVLDLFCLVQARVKHTQSAG